MVKYVYVICSSRCYFQFMMAAPIGKQTDIDILWDKIQASDGIQQTFTASLATSTIETKWNKILEIKILKKKLSFFP